MFARPVGQGLLSWKQQIGMGNTQSTIAYLINNTTILCSAFCAEMYFTGKPFAFICTCQSFYSNTYPPWRLKWLCNLSLSLSLPSLFYKLSFYSTINTHYNSFSRVTTQIYVITTYRLMPTLFISICLSITMIL